MKFYKISFFLFLNNIFSETDSSKFSKSECHICPCSTKDDKIIRIPFESPIGDESKTLISGIYKLLMSKENLPINIGSPCELTIKKIAKIIIKLTNSKSKIVYKPLQQKNEVRKCEEFIR